MDSGNSIIYLQFMLNNIIFHGMLITLNLGVIIMKIKEAQKEVDQNYAAFQEFLPDLMRENSGRWVLMHNREVIAIFDTARDAHIAGEKLYVEKPFSVQKINDSPIDLGWFSHAVP